MILWYLIAPRSSRTSRYSPSSGKHFSRVDDRNVAPSLHQSCLHGARVIVWWKYRLYINRFCTVAVFFSVVRVVYSPWPPAIGFFRVICSRLELCFESQRRNSKGRGGEKKKKRKKKSIPPPFIGANSLFRFFFVSFPSERAVRLSFHSPFVARDQFSLIGVEIYTNIRGHVTLLDLNRKVKYANPFSHYF